MSRKPLWYHRPVEQEGDSKFLGVDWADTIRRAAVWEQLAPVSRRLLSGRKTNHVLRPSEVGSDLDVLERTAFLDVTQNRATARMSQSAMPFFRLLRALERNDLVAQHDPNAFLVYVRDHFTGEQRSRLVALTQRWGSERDLARQAASASWLRSFADDTRTTAFLPEASVGAARTLVQWFLDHPAWVPLHELPRRVPALSEAALASGLRLCFERLLLFPAFRRPDLTIVVGPWPSVAERLSEPAPVLPTARAAEREFEGAFLIDDMIVLLVAASTEPLRTRKSDGALFERTHSLLCEQLAPLPEWVRAVEWFSPETRVRQARATLESMKLLVASRGTLRPGRATPTGSRWRTRDGCASCSPGCVRSPMMILMMHCPRTKRTMISICPCRSTTIPVSLPSGEIGCVCCPAPC